MSVVDTLASSVIKVVSGILGFGLLVSGGQQAAYNSETVGPIVFFIGVVLLVFASKM